MENIPCKKCGSLSRIFTMKILGYNKHNAAGEVYRVTAPQVTERCGNCNTFQRFAPQTDEMLEKFNQILREIVVFTPEKEERKLI